MLECYYMDNQLEINKKESTHSARISRMDACMHISRVSATNLCMHVRRKRIRRPTYQHQYHRHQRWSSTYERSPASLISPLVRYSPAWWRRRADSLYSPGNESHSLKQRKGTVSGVIQRRGWQGQHTTGRVHHFPSDWDIKWQLTFCLVAVQQSKLI